MKRSLGAISIGLNLALLGVLIFCLRPGRIPAKADPERKLGSPSTIAFAQATNVIDVTNTAVSVVKFHWREIESSDYPTYLANLRAFHCPEKTIFDIIFADIEKLFTERAKKLEVAEKFWATGDDLEKARLAKEQKQADLIEEKRALIKTLLNSDLDWEVMQEWYKEKELGMYAGFLEDSQAERALSVAKKFADRIEAVDARASGLLIPEDAEEKKRVYAEMRSALGEIISSAELEEGELRAVFLSSYLFSSKDLQEARLSGPEVHQIMQLKLRFDNPLEHELGKYDGNDALPEELSKQDFLARVKLLLGEFRYQHYLRAHDSDFQRLCKLGEENGLRPQVAMAVFDAQSAATLESLPIRENNLLPRRERRLQLESVERATHDAIQQMLGEKVMARYSTNGGGWIKELGKP